MKRLLKKTSSKYISFSRFLLIFFLILLIVLYVAVYVVVNRELYANARQTANHLYSRVSAISGETALVYNSLVTSDEVSGIIQGDGGSPESVMDLCRKIKLSTDTSPYINHIYLFNFDDGKIYSDLGPFAASSQDYILSTFGGNMETLYEDSSDGSFHLFNDKMFTPYCVYPVYEEAGQADGISSGQRGAMVICLDMTQFLRIFYEIDAAVCTIYSSDAYVTSLAGPLPDRFDWSDASNVAEVVGSKVFCYYLTDNDLTYMIAKEKSLYNRPLTIIAIVFGVYALITFAAGFISFLRNRRRVRQRYAVLAEILPDTFAGDSSFGQMYDRIQSSLKDYSIQREQLATASREKALMQLLSGSAVTDDVLNASGIPDGAPDYYIAAFSARLHEDNSGETTDREFPALIQRATITELANQQNMSFAVCESEYALVALFYGIHGSDGKEALVRLCNDAVSLINSNYKIPSRVIISDSVDSTEELAGVWQSLSELQRFTYSVNSRAACIRMDNISQHSDLLDNSDYIRQEQILINSILARKYEIIPDLASSILSSYVLSPGDNYRIAQQRFVSVRNILAEGIRSAAGSETSENADRLYQCESIDELIELARTVYSALAEGDRLGKSSGSEVSAVQNYIDQNLADPNLSVSMVSEAVNINLSRLIRVFQAEAGMSVADYINFQRIQTARKLLKETDMTVTQIADKVGYNNADTFTRNFRKQQNMTPTEYRRLQEKHPEE